MFITFHMNDTLLKKKNFYTNIMNPTTTALYESGVEVI